MTTELGALHRYIAAFCFKILYQMNSATKVHQNGKTAAHRKKTNKITLTDRLGMAGGTEKQTTSRGEDKKEASVGRRRDLLPLRMSHFWSAKQGWIRASVEIGTLPQFLCVHRRCRLRLRPENLDSERHCEECFPEVLRINLRMTMFRDFNDYTFHQSFSHTPNQRTEGISFILSFLVFIFFFAYFLTGTKFLCSGRQEMDR